MLNEPDEDGIIKAVVADLDLGTTVLDVYMLPSGEKRLGIEAVGVALGKSKRFLTQRTKRQSKTLEALQGMGFSGEQIQLKIIRQGDSKRGAVLAKTISVRDFVKLTAFEAIRKRNLQAIILLAAFAEVGLDKTLDDLFAGRSIAFIFDKIVHYSKWTYEEFEQALAENREEVRQLYNWYHTT